MGKVGRVLSDLVVGSHMLVSVAKCTEFAIEEGHNLAAVVQDYAGNLGSGIVEYGLPIATLIGTLAVSALAVKATDSYMSK